MALAGTEIVGDQMETPPSGDENPRKWGTHSGVKGLKKKPW